MILTQLNENKINDLKESLDKKEKDNYMCNKCHNCMFYEDINMGMDGTIKKCNIKNKHLQSIDCNNNYYRVCKYFCSTNELDNFIQNKKNEILERINNEQIRR